MIKKASISVFISLFNKRFLSILWVLALMWGSSCKDIIFNNPLDPEASKDVVQIIKIIETPLSGPGDIAFDGEKFWKINPYGGLTAFDRETGSVIRYFEISGGSAVSFYLDSLFIDGSEGENILVELDPLSGDTINRYSTGDLYPRFITASPTHLIIFDQRSNGIFEYDPETGDSARLFEISGLNIGGIAYYKGELLITDMNTDSLYRFTLTGQAIGVYSSPTAGIGGVGVDYSGYVYLFIVDGKLYKVTLP